MSIDLTVVTVAEPNPEAAQRLAECALDSLRGAVDLAAVPVFQLEAGFHEFDGEFAAYLTSPTREPESYLATLVLGASLAVLYGGRLVDDSGFFPRLSANEVLRRCFSASGNSPRELWERLAVAES